MNYTEQQIKESFEKIPDDIQAILVDPDFGSLVFALTVQQNLAGEVALDIEDIITHTLLGLIPFKDLKEEMQKLGVPIKAAENLLIELQNNIFNDVQESLNSLQQKDSVASHSTEPKIIPLMPKTMQKDASPTQNQVPGNLPTAPGIPLIKPNKMPPAPTQKPTINTAPPKPKTPRHIFEKNLKAKQEQPAPKEPPKPAPALQKPAPPAPALKKPTPPTSAEPPTHADPYREQV